MLSLLGENKDNRDTQYQLIKDKEMVNLSKHETTKPEIFSKIKADVGEVFRTNNDKTRTRQAWWERPASQHSGG